MKFAGPTAHWRVRSPVTPLGRCVVGPSPPRAPPRPSAAKVGATRDRQPPVHLPRGSGDCTGPMDSERRVRITCKYAAISVVPSLDFSILHFCDFCVSPLLLFGGLLGVFWAFVGLGATSHDPL